MMPCGVYAQLLKTLCLVDLYHLTEKLAAAAHAIDSDSKVAGERLNRWKMVLLNRGSAATDILQELVRSGLDDLNPAHSTGVKAFGKPV
jgi:hypothetical protein